MKITSLKSLLDLRLEEFDNNVIQSGLELFKNVTESECKHGVFQILTSALMNIKGKMEINSYQGTRHKKGLPVHGQRTSRNAKTRKGKGKVVANKKKVGK